MTTHELKIWPEYFEAVAAGNKKFELRKADRNFEVGDYLHLREWDPKTNAYTDSSVLAQITYILEGPHAIPGMCLMSIEVMVSHLS